MYGKHLAHICFNFFEFNYLIITIERCRTMRELMTGNEAIARGVYESGVGFASAYPGTPSTEILETLSSPQYRQDLYAEWAPNEKVALEAAIGFSWMGGRAFASMKQVGLNVAADPMFSLAYTGCNGGLVLVTADEPGIHSSQTEQDNRLYADAAKLPMLEPSDSQECKDMVLAAMELSESYRSPVLIRMTTRICHSKSMVELGTRKDVPCRPYEKNIWQYTTMPAVSKKLRVELVDKLEKLQQESEKSPLNFEIDNNVSIGVITSGISYQYARDAFGEKASYLKLGFPYPLPIEKIRNFAEKMDILYVIEETEPFLERQIRAAGIRCHGKDLLPCIGELSAEIIREKLMGLPTTYV
jgi:indolepyruvate ferredoxin oxidoreductase alpha subunit